MGGRLEGRRAIGDAAGAAVALAADVASYVTGAVWAADGGMTAI